jgi:hypothetical protein
MVIPREGFNTPVESIGTWASYRDEDVLRPASNNEDAEPGRNDLAATQIIDSYLKVLFSLEAMNLIGGGTLP